MSIVLIDGTDLYNGTGTNTGLQAKWALGTAATWSLVTGRFGGQAVRRSTASNANGYMERAWAGGGISSGTIHVAMYFTAIPVNNTAETQHIGLSSGATQTLGIRVDTAGAIRVYRNTNRTAGTLLATSASGVVTAGVWNFFEIEFVISDAAGRVSIYMNGSGTPVINVSSVDTNNAVTTVDTISFGSCFGEGVSFDWDDLYITNSSTRSGERRVETVRPTADTAQKDFTPNTGSTNYTQVDDTTANGDTDYVQASTVGNTDRYTFGALSSTPSTISAVQVTSFAEKTDAASRTINLQVKSGATTSDGSAFSLAASYGKFDRILETDPDTGSAWGASAVNAIEAGPKVAS